MATLPKELDYTKKLQALPTSTKTISVVLAPSNNTSFSQNEIIQIDLPSRSFLVPNSMYLRYKHTITDASGDILLGCPATSPFSRLETIIGSQVVESITDWNVVNNMIFNTKLSTAQKWSMANCLGYKEQTKSISATCTPETANGATYVTDAATSFTRAFPVNCILSNANNLIPLGMMPSVRLQLTLETITNMFSGTVTASTISDVELCFDLVDFGPEVDAIVRSMADANGNLVIKSQSYSLSTLTIPSGTSGSLEYTFNQRLSSIKSIFAHISNTSEGAKKFGAKDVCAGSGSYQFIIGSELYPPRPLDASKKASMFLELIQAVYGNTCDLTNVNCSIIPSCYNCNENVADTGLLPGMFYIGANVERLSSNDFILSGISSQLSPISVRIQINTSTTDTHNLSLICNHDSLIEVNVLTRQVSVRQ